MKFLPFLMGNLLRKKQRTLLTILSVMIAFLLLCALAATNNSFKVDMNLVGKNRLLSFNRLSRNEPLPLSYYNRISALDGINNATHITSFGGFYQEAANPISSFAIDGKSYFEINPEIEIPAAQKDAWLRNRIGIIVGADLAREYGWKIGDQIPLQSSVWRGTSSNNVWEVVVEAIFRDTRSAELSEALFMHYAYLNDGRNFQTDTVSAYQTLVADAARADEIASRVDAMFRNAPTQTKTASELVFVRDLLAQFANMGAMVTAVASVVFFTLLLTIASTLGQSIRERAKETAVLRVIGFRKKTLMALVLAESTLLTIVGGSLGILFSLPLIDYIADQRGASFALDSTDIVAMIALIIGFGCLAGLLPGLAAVRGRPVEMLRGE